MVIGSERIGMGTKQGAALGLSLGIGHMRLSIRSGHRSLSLGIGLMCLSIRSGHWGLSLWGLGDGMRGK